MFQDLSNFKKVRCWTFWQSRRPLKSMRLLFSTLHCQTHMRLLWPTWDCFVLYETRLSHMRLLLATWDRSVPHETDLSHMSHICPTWDCSVPNETVLSHMRLLCIFSLSCIVIIFWDLYVLIGTGMGRDLEWDWDWDRTGTGLRRDWDNCRTEVLRYCKEIQAKSRLK